MANIFLVFVFLFSGSVIAASVRVDSESLSSCDGEVSLRESSNGSHSLKVSAQNCKNVVIKDANNLELKKYKLKGDKPPFKGTVVLSKKVIQLASENGRLYFDIASNSGKHIDSFVLILREEPLPVEGEVRSGQLPQNWMVSFDVLSLLLGFEQCVLLDGQANTVALLEHSICEDEQVVLYNKLPKGWKYSWSIGGDCYLYDGVNRSVSLVTSQYCQ